MVIGIVGGVGSGKSTVLEYLENRHNAYIIESDKVARKIIEPGHEAYKRVLDAFPEISVYNDGFINRTQLAQIVFTDKKKLELLNSITHPEAIREIKEMIFEQKNSNIIVVESALLIGTEIEKSCDEIWFVYCEQEERIKRLIENRGYSREGALDIIKNQMSDDEFNAISDEFIDNSNSKVKTEEQIDIILNSQNCNNI